MGNDVIMKSQHSVPKVETDDVAEWFVEHIGDQWGAGAPDVSVDGDEILIVLDIGDADVGDDLTGEERRASRSARISNFREETRGRRMEIAAAAEVRFGRKVSWGVRAGDLGLLFTHLSVPAMTRLRIKERIVLDTLIDAGVARSRSDALAWCVRLVGKNLDEWLDDLRDALVHVEEVRKRGPDA
jgi:hypothetical protein